MRQRNVAEVALNHQHHANGTRLDGLLPTEHKAKLATLFRNTIPVHIGRPRG
jgi:hypothetical protein